MDDNEILKECVERKKLAPEKTSAQIVAEVVEEVNGYKSELRKRYLQPETLVKP